jgi:uncharacterized protein
MRTGPPFGGDGPGFILCPAAACYDGSDGTEYVLWESANERVVERILPGAFDKALARPDDVRGLFNHNPDHVLGRARAGTMSLAVDARGLRYVLRPGDTAIARDVRTHIERKDVDGSSFSFVPKDETWVESRDAAGKWHVVREVRDVVLYDAGPVTFPAYTGSTASTRAAGDAEEARRSLESFRRSRGDVGLAGRLASYRARALEAVSIAAL